MLKDKLKFIDLFAGIGGFRLGMEKAGFECVGGCEIDEHACEMYLKNFGDDPKCDITQLDPSTLPDFDILCAGFPCQAFSICGQREGFYDETRGTLFFDICRILEHKKPPVFILENVQFLEKHDKGRTLAVILHSLHDLGYSVDYKVLNARDFGVPQNRQRIIIVGNLYGKFFDFEKIKTNTINSMKPFLDKEGFFEYLDPEEYTLIDNYKKQRSGLIFRGYRNKKIRKKGVREGTEHLSRVHKQPNRIYSAEGNHPTIASTETSGRYWIYDEGRVRKLTLNECFKFMGFPADFIKIGPQSKIYERIGNSICVNMVEAVGNEIKTQLFEEGENISTDEVTKFLEKVYNEANQAKLSDIKLTREQMVWARNVATNEENYKGVFTVLVTSLTYKCLHPEQDVRIHQKNMFGGYSGRSFDTKFVTPFLKIKRFAGAMKESGWLTRSLEQNLPYKLDYPGKIKNLDVKSGFLNILNDLEKNGADPREYLKAIFKISLIEKSKKVVDLVNPIQSESDFNISDIINSLNNHFYFDYKSRGASILPVIAIYSLYEVLINEISRFDRKYLDELQSHTSCDRSSGATGDIVIKNQDDDEIYEVVEVKFEIPIDYLMVDDAYQKIKTKKIQRYYILSTINEIEEMEKIQELIYKVRKEHGCQIIVNGVFPTIKYYLRLMENTDKFIENYIENLGDHSEINYEHKIAWNKALKNSKHG
ncbi:MAG: DNA (cytosine-5-)-methyltransferase [Methanobacterium formicicum]|uniref:DNA (Cytosine-5-)-methyltransferase n=1 Tax=Methanobacterium formicicum TaxID=2162 RepID=A0A843AGM9_METFO|nr:DNA (cytosine-5-)-methyltransferase [Methanobacterium formicicum]